jgi:hypothetical protein
MKRTNLLVLKVAQSGFIEKTTAGGTVLAERVCLFD